MTLVGRRIVNDVSYVRGFNHESDFSWQAQYNLVDLECDFCGSIMRVMFRGRCSIW